MYILVVKRWVKSCSVCFGVGIVKYFWIMVRSNSHSSSFSTYKINRTPIRHTPALLLGPSGHAALPRQHTAHDCCLPAYLRCAVEQSRARARAPPPAVPNQSIRRAPAIAAAASSNWTGVACSHAPRCVAFTPLSFSRQSRGGRIPGGTLQTCSAAEQGLSSSQQHCSNTSETRRYYITMNLSKCWLLFHCF